MGARSSVLLRRSRSESGRVDPTDQFIARRAFGNTYQLGQTVPKLDWAELNTMGKGFTGKTCVYCCDAKSVAGDHVFARKLFLESRRANLPKVPACKSCNGQKSELEHYVTTLLPFGGRHTDAAKNLVSMVPKRLEKNTALHTLLQRGMKRVWTREKGLLMPTGSVPFDWPMVEQWLVFVVKGLAWHHWKVLIGSDFSVEIFALTPHGEAVFQRLLTMPAAERIRQDVGAGTFSYEAAQGIDIPQISVWEFSIYGGVKLRDRTAPEQTVSKIGAMVGPKRVPETAKLTAMGPQ